MAALQAVAAAAIAACLVSGVDAAWYYNDVPDTPPDVCFQKPMVGPCLAQEKRWFSNQATGECEAFLWGGCNSKGKPHGRGENNFDTKYQCEQKCFVPWEKRFVQPSLCRLRFDVGYGKQSDYKYYYAPEAKTCITFKYRGNGGNENRFVSMANCLQTCDPDRQEGMGYICEQPMQPLDCPTRNLRDPDAMERYYYSIAMQKCIPFRFGGCGYTLADGNKNNFATKSDCYNQCKHYKPNSYTTSTEAPWLSTTTAATICPEDRDKVVGGTPEPLNERRANNKRCNQKCESFNMRGSYMRRPTPNGCWHTCMCECPKPIKKGKCKRKCKKQGFEAKWHRDWLYSGTVGSFHEPPFQCKQVCECLGKFAGSVGQRDPEDPVRAANLSELVSGDHPSKKKRKNN